MNLASLVIAPRWGLGIAVLDGGPLDPVPVDPDAVRAAACRLVESASVCSPPQPPPQVELGPPPVGFNFLSLLLQGVLVLAVLALLVLVARLILGLPPLHRRRRLATEPDDDPDHDAPAGTVIIDHSRQPHDWRAEAAAHRGEGRWRDALRCRYRALVGDLARIGLLDEIPGRTTGEERRQLTLSAANIVEPFNRAADLFDRGWFGHWPLGAADDDRFVALDAQILALAVPLPQRVPRRDLVESV